MKITMIGAGYVGLVSSACFADFGHEVICVDYDISKLDQLKLGKMPIYEPGLDLLVARNVNHKRLRFTSDLASAVSASDVVFIAVGTPSRRGDGHADLSYVYEAAKEIGKALTGFTVIVTKSTVPVGTGDEVERIIKEINPQAQFSVVSNPEFLREGSAIEDFKRPDRIVVGTENPKAISMMSEIYRPLTLNASLVYYTSRRTAELIKYAANAFLAMKITFINEIADLCEKLDTDVQEVARGIGMDGRIGSKFLHAGPGYGGSCFPKDTQALIKTAQDVESPMRLIETTVAINEQRKRSMGRKIIQACGGTVRDKKIAILGLTFKPNTDDMRDAPSIPIIQVLQDGGAIITAYDPVGMQQAQKILTDVQFADSIYQAAENADALVILTEWDEFRSLDLGRLRMLMKKQLMIDLRNIYPRDEATREGFSYVGVGVAKAHENHNDFFCNRII